MGRHTKSRSGGRIASALRAAQKSAPPPTDSIYEGNKKFPRINVWGMVYNVTMRDEQAEEIIEALNDYYANPQDYTIADLEEIFQDRDPFEFL